MHKKMKGGGKKMESVKVIIFEPNRKGYIKTIPNTLKSFQEVVGGYIECVPLDENILICCDEEGRLKGKAVNRTVSGISFAGTIVVTAYDEEGEHISLTEAQIRRYLDI